jgi:hypothetical protein
MRKKTTTRTYDFLFSFIKSCVKRGPKKGKNMDMSSGISVIGAPFGEKINWLAVQAVEVRVSFWEETPLEISGRREQRKAGFYKFFLVDRKTTLGEFVQAVYLIVYHERWVKDFEWHDPVTGIPHIDIHWVGYRTIYATDRFERGTSSWPKYLSENDLVGDFHMSEDELAYRAMVMKTGQEKPHAREPLTGGDKESDFFTKRPWAKAKAGGEMNEDEDEDYEELF